MRTDAGEQQFRGHLQYPVFDRGRRFKHIGEGLRIGVPFAGQTALAGPHEFQIRGGEDAAAFAFLPFAAAAAQCEHAGQRGVMGIYIGKHGYAPDLETNLSVFFGKPFHIGPVGCVEGLENTFP